MKINLAKWEWNTIADMLEHYPMGDADKDKPWLRATVISIRNQIASSEKYWRDKKMAERKEQVKSQTEDMWNSFEMSREGGGEYD